MHTHLKRNPVQGGLGLLRKMEMIVLDIDSDAAQGTSHSLSLAHHSDTGIDKSGRECELCAGDEISQTHCDNRFANTFASEAYH